MSVLCITEQQDTAVRIDRGEVDAVFAQQRQQQICADPAEVAGHDAVKVGFAPSSRSRQESVSQAAGEDVILGLCGLSMLADIVLCCRIGIRKLEFYRDFTALMDVNHVDQFDNDFARQRLQIAVFDELRQK